MVRFLQSKISPWLKSLLFASLKKQLVAEMKRFRWSERELAVLRENAFTEAQIRNSEEANRVAGEAWIERQLNL